MSVGDYVKIGALKSLESFRDYQETLGAGLPLDEAVLSAPESPLSHPIEVLGRTVGNRFAIHPMEGWDGTTGGRPTERTIRRWKRFGSSGAKLIWGGEAVAVRYDARANPNQLVLTAETAPDIAALRESLVSEHQAAFGRTDDLLIGLQLTHSGRFSRPNRKDLAEPQIVYHHPILDPRMGLAADSPVLSDSDIEGIVADFVKAARLAQRCGFDFVDIKHCHGYFAHELLSAYTRPGVYGGSLENRTRFLREVVEGIRVEAPGLGIGVRLSAFDLVPFRPDPDQSMPGKPGPGLHETYCDFMPYRYAFGVNVDQPTEPDLQEPLAFVQILRELDVRFVNLSAGSPYYNPHIQRPALYPPSDGYLPPEDPLIGVARQMHVTRHMKQAFPDFTIVGSAYSYLQEYLPYVAQAAIRAGWTDLVGLGRMVLAYSELPADLISGRPLQTKRLCRTFSDCTTAPRNGLPSGCYPLDPFYKTTEDAVILARLKNASKPSGIGNL